MKCPSFRKVRKRIKIGLFYYLPDKIAINLFYFFKFGRFPDLKNPQTLNDKIQWLKLFDRSVLHTVCADKFLVREFVSREIGSEYLIPLVKVYEDVDLLRVEEFPDYPCIVKSTHNSGDYFVVRDKHEVDFNSLRRRFRKSLKTNYYRISKEWQYRNISPRIIIEKLLLTKEGDLPMDYKIHCFNGVPQMVQVDIDRGKLTHARNWYSADWGRLPFKWSSRYNGRFTDPVATDLPKPENFDEMLHISKKLSMRFAYARIDLYNLNGILFFGEITFHHDGGFARFRPSEYDYFFGQKLILPH